MADTSHPVHARDYSEERIDPEASPAEFLQEHAARYVLAAPYCRDRDVLDVASGIGYGTDYLQKQGARAVGLEIDPKSVRYSQSRYPGPTYVQGVAEKMAAGWSHAFDVVVSFETIEHLSQPADFLQEVFRCLRPGGRFICSTPNKSLSLFQSGNRFHLREFYFGDFLQFVGTRFHICDVFGQSFHPRWRVLPLASRALARKLLRALSIPPLGISGIFSKGEVPSPFEEGSIAENRVLPDFMPSVVRRGTVPSFIVVVAQKGGR